jgi:hypothetical protein
MSFPIGLIFRYHLPLSKWYETKYGEQSKLYFGTQIMYTTLNLLTYLSNPSSSFIYSHNIELITCGPRVFKVLFWHITIKKRNYRTTICTWAVQAHSRLALIVVVLTCG